MSRRGPAFLTMIALTMAASGGLISQTSASVAGAGARHRQPEKHAVEVGRGGAVSTVDPTATRAGIKVLRQGGNAVDAAVAAAATLGVTEPYVAGIGGGGFMVVYRSRDGRITTIDGRETAPRTFHKDAFINPKRGKPIRFYPNRVTSGLAVGVPGTLRSWQEALDRYGTMSLSRVLQPAIDAGRRGFVVDRTFHDDTVENLPRFRAFTPTRRLFLTRKGSAPPVGSLLRNPDLAKTYQLVARKGVGTLYGGVIGRAIVDTVHHPPLAPRARLGFPVRRGVMSVSDLRSYDAPLRKPTQVEYRGHDVYGMAPPSSGGSTVGEALNILEGFPLGGSGRPLALHRVLEASRLAFADRNRYIGDPAYVDVPLRALLSPGFAAERRCLIRGRALRSPVSPGNPRPPHDRTCPRRDASAPSSVHGGSTNHITVVDRDGNVVSYTNTIEQLGGSAIAVPGYGFLLNNELTDFDPQPLVPGVPDPNLPAGGKRPRSSMSPTIVLHDGRPVLAVGSPGGATIITTVLGILINRFDFDMSLPEAIAAPRASQLNSPTTLAEPDFLSAYGAALRKRFGQRFTAYPELGAATGIEVLRNGLLRAVAEPERRGGGDAEVVHPGR